MHEQHQANSSQHDHAMNQRGDQGMGFAQDKTTHHFLLSNDGGVIQVTANSADDQASIDQIRMHLKHIARAFQAGDFNIPMFVHDQTPPGVPAMQNLKGARTLTPFPLCRSFFASRSKNIRLEMRWNNEP
jgi:hypothetical protein